MRKFKGLIFEDLFVKLPNACWQWLGSFNGDGYGLYWTSAKTRAMAHIFAYKKYKGNIADNLQLDHTCKNRGCVNPDHLEPVTGIENTRRGLRSKLSLLIIKDIKDLYDKGTPQTLIARRFGVDQSQISRVINNKSWLE